MARIPSRVADAFPLALDWLRRSASVWLRRYRRSRIAKKRVRSRQVYVLLATLVILAGVFAASLAYLAPKPNGQRISLDQLGALASQKRIAMTVFRDEDARIAGTFFCFAGEPGGKAGESPAKSSPDNPVPFASPAATAPACPAGMSAIAPAAAGQAPAEAGSKSGKNGATANTKNSSPAGYVPALDPTAREIPFWVSYPQSDAATAILLQMVSDAGSRVSVDPQTSKAQWRMVTTFVLPLMLLANLFVLLFAGGKAGSSGIGEVEMFGSIGKGGLRGRRRRSAAITFADVAGADEAVEELKEVRDYLANPNRYEEIGARPPKGVLLIGPPGCGKTLLAKAVAGEVGVPFFSVAGAEFVESLVGVGAARVRDLFRRVRAAAPAVVFIDELDAAGRRRAQGGGAGGNEEREQTLNQILVDMDGFDVSAGIVVMAATNRPDILDPALLRPGRFDRHVTVDRPDLLGRIRILELHASGKPFSPEVDFGYVARRTPGFSGADLANVVNEAALLAVRERASASPDADADGAEQSEIRVDHVDEAIQRTLIGTVRKGRILTPEERKRAAFHESGHVIVAAAIGKVDEVHRVSILAAGRTLGSTSRSDSEAALLTRTQLQARLVTHMAGVAAEELVFGEPSTGAERDLEQASALARDIVARYGMSERLGRTRLLSRDVDEFLDAETSFAAISGMTQQDVDAEVRRLLADAEREAGRLLAVHRDTLNVLAARLEFEETLEGPDLEAVLALVRPEVELFGGFMHPNGHKDVSVAAAPTVEEVE